MDMYILRDTPPEKYYEACITYHLVRYFERMYNRRLYPFSISQVREKQLGFDFGYALSKGNVFLTQYKRPCGKGKQGTMWEIQKEQAALLAQQPVRSFYVLPTFLKQEEWYEGLDKTFFVPTGSVYAWVCSKQVNQSALLHENERVVSASDPKGFDPFGGNLSSVLLAEPNSSAEDFLEQMPGEMAEQICGYWIGGGIDDGAWQLF